MTKHKADPNLRDSVSSWCRRLAELCLLASCCQLSVLHRATSTATSSLLHEERCVRRRSVSQGGSAAQPQPCLASPRRQLRSDRWTERAPAPASAGHCRRSGMFASTSFGQLSLAVDCAAPDHPPAPAILATAALPSLATVLQPLAQTFPDLYGRVVALNNTAELQAGASDRVGRQVQVRLSRTGRPALVALPATDGFVFAGQNCCTGLRACEPG